LDLHRVGASATPPARTQLNRASSRLRHNGPVGLQGQSMGSSRSGRWVSGDGRAPDHVTELPAPRPPDRAEDGSGSRHTREPAPAVHPGPGAAGCPVGSSRGVPGRLAWLRGCRPGPAGPVATRRRPALPGCPPPGAGRRGDGGAVGGEVQELWIGEAAVGLIPGWIPGLALLEQRTVAQLVERDEVLLGVLDAFERIGGRHGTVTGECARPADP
jgi:hypothetical protein